MSNKLTLIFSTDNGTPATVPKFPKPINTFPPVAAPRAEPITSLVVVLPDEPVTAIIIGLCRHKTNLAKIIKISSDIVLNTFFIQFPSVYENIEADKTQPHRKSARRYFRQTLHWLGGQ